jgi:UMF1 family MFS transporter
MFAAFLFGLSELQILFLGVFINLFGIFGCLIIGSFEDKIGSENTVKICVLGLLITTLTLFFIKSIHWFWILALIIGFFVGPIQASSRSVLVKKIKAKNQLSAFCVFSMFGNLCAILGPFVVGITVDITGSIRDGILVIPIFFCLSLFPYMRRR